MVSLEGLTKVVDPSQLTADFDGSLDYNHEEWIEVRQPTHPVSQGFLPDLSVCPEIPVDVQLYRSHNQ